MSSPTPLPWPSVAEASAAAEDLPAPPEADHLVRLAATATPLSRWLLAPAPADVLGHLGQVDIAGTWPLNAVDEDGEVALRDLSGPHDADAVALDYQRLFVGPGRMEVAPYESVHTSQEGLLFEPETLDVRAWYRHYGLVAPRQGKEPDDHIGLELEFLAALAEWALDALDQGDLRSAAVYAQGARRFADAHLIPWVPGFCASVRDRADTAFHRGVAGATASLVDVLPVLLSPAEVA